MLSEADATRGWALHKHPGQGTMLTRTMYRRRLTVWEDGNLFQFVVDDATRTLKWVRRSAAAAAKFAAEKAARPGTVTE